MLTTDNKKKYLDSAQRYCISCSKNLHKIVKDALLEKFKTVFSDCLFVYLFVSKYTNI
jgi:hypothetical protein